MQLETKHFRFAVGYVLLMALSGSATFVFLRGLEWVTSARIGEPAWFLFCPVAGLLTGWLYELASHRTGEGNVLLARHLRRGPKQPPAPDFTIDPQAIGEALQEGVLKPEDRVPARLSPLILVTTWLAHLGGVSVGREGTAVQMAGGLSAWVGRALKLSEKEKWRLLLVSAAAGFGSVFGVPLAGGVFALEFAGLFTRSPGVLAVPTNRVKVIVGLLLLSLFASLGANAVALWLGTTHASYPHPLPSEYLSGPLAFMLLMASVGSGLLAWGFLFLVARVRRVFAIARVPTWLKPALGGVPIAFLYFFPSSHRYAGLGADSILQSFQSGANFLDPLAKLAFTAYGIGAGFRGGEVTPLFFIGSTFGSALGGMTGMNGSILAGLSMVAVFGAAARAPIACAIMAGELFGWPAFIAALPFCFFASSICRTARLYDHH